MRFRWLLGNFADPEQDRDLTPREQHEISNRAHKEYMPTWRFVWRTLLTIVLPFLLLSGVAMPSVLGWLGLSGRNLPYFIGIAVIVLLAWPFSAFVYGRLYVVPVRRAMREHGIDLCLGCGYVLDNLPEDVTRCPECGCEREGRAAG